MTSLISFPAGNDVEFGFATLIDDTPFTPISVSMRVNGPAGVLADWSSVPIVQSSDGATCTLVVPAALNTLSVATVPEARSIDVKIDGGSIIGVQVLSQEYLLGVDTEQLVLMSNTFQTYVEALGVAAGIDTPAWDAAEPDARRGVLMSAYDDIAHHAFDLGAQPDDAYDKSRASWGLPISQAINRLYLFSVDEFNALPFDFRRKLKLAQVIEADARLASDPMDALRTAGVTSHKVGETEMRWSASTPLKLGLSRRTLMALSPYLRFAPRLTRV